MFCNDAGPFPKGEKKVEGKGKEDCLKTQKHLQHLNLGRAPGNELGVEGHTQSWGNTNRISVQSLQTESPASTQDTVERPRGLGTSSEVQTGKNEAGS